MADGETGDEDLIEDIPELQEVDRKEASKRSFYISFLTDFFFFSVCKCIYPVGIAKRKTKMKPN